MIAIFIATFFLFVDLQAQQKLTVKYASITPNQFKESWNIFKERHKGTCWSPQDLEKKDFVDKLMDLYVIIARTNPVCDSQQSIKEDFALLQNFINEEQDKKKQLAQKLFKNKLKKKSQKQKKKQLAQLAKSKASINYQTLAQKDDPFFPQFELMLDNWLTYIRCIARAYSFTCAHCDRSHYIFGEKLLWNNKTYYLMAQAVEVENNVMIKDFFQTHLHSIVVKLKKTERIDNLKELVMLSNTFAAINLEVEQCAYQHELKPRNVKITENSKSNLVEYNPDPYLIFFIPVLFQSIVHYYETNKIDAFQIPKIICTKMEELIQGCAVISRFKVDNFSFEEKKPTINTVQDLTAVLSNCEGTQSLIKPFIQNVMPKIPVINKSFFKLFKEAILTIMSVEKK